MYPGQPVYVRDRLHRHYVKWGKAVFVKELNSEKSRYLVEFLWASSGRPMKVCGQFPECKPVLDKGDEVLERVYA